MKPSKQAMKLRAETETLPSSWSCRVCTFVHDRVETLHYLTCQMCGTTRDQGSSVAIAANPYGSIGDSRSAVTSVSSFSLATTSAATASEKDDCATASCDTPHRSARSASPRSDISSQSPTVATTMHPKKQSSAAWGSLKPPTARDIRGKRRVRKALDAPPQQFDYLVVLDFEWTADNQRRMEPTAEITQFPSVVMQLVERKKQRQLRQVPSALHDNHSVPLPDDLVQPSTHGFRRDALAISAFDTFVRPTFNPILTDFSIELTAITQKEVDAAPTIDVVLKRYMAWLQDLGLVHADDGSRIGRWCFCTWGDGDIMQTLRRELQIKSIPLPPCFDTWINLKSDAMFKKHYGREPRGGLRTCVESVGATWEGRAHNGLVDSINTAKIVRHMVQTGFLFHKPTRGLDKDGIPFGQKKRKRL